MNTPASALDPGLVALARRAAELESRGAWAEAIAAWSSAVETHPSFLPARLGLAQALIRAGKPADALPVLGRISAAAPNLPAVWLALAVAQSMLGRHDLAVDNAKRAAALAPNAAAVHAGLGDVLRQAGRLADAASAYRTAVAKAPDDPEPLNKLSVIERAEGRLGAAAKLLRHAFGRAPQHPYVRVNLGTLELELGHEAEGRALLEPALVDPRVPRDAREEASDALAAVAEHAAMAAPIAAALAARDPAPIAAALRSSNRSTGVDSLLLDRFRAIGEQLASAEPIDRMFAPGAPRASAWPAIEAFHNFHTLRDREDLDRCVALVAHPDRARSEDDLDIVSYARVVADGSHEPPDGADAVALEAWLRWRHAELVGHRPSLRPGQVKLVNNLIGSAPDIPLTRSGQFPEALRTVIADLAPRVPPGAWRAVYLYAALIRMHPFADGNGRVMRLCLNRQLVRAGLFPHLRAEGGDGAVMHLAQRGDFAPLVEHLAEGSRRGAALDAEWLEREAR